MKQPQHPFHIVTPETSNPEFGNPPPNLRLHRLPHNAIIRPGDWMTARTNIAPDGLLSADTFKSYRVSKVTQHLVFYRPTFI